MASKYGVGQVAQWIRPNLHLIVGQLDDGAWRWSDHPLPHEVKCNLRERDVFKRTDDGLWYLDSDVVDAVEMMAEECGHDVNEIFADA
jgi:hypothetical protein